VLACKKAVVMALEAFIEVLRESVKDDEEEAAEDVPE